MTVAAPPQPPPVNGSAGDDPSEALIKEAKQRARRRRWIYGGAVVVVAIAAVAAITLPGSPSSPHGAARALPKPPTPLGAPLVQGPDPASTLLTSWGAIHVGYAFVYADGRVIWYPDAGAHVDPDMEVTGAQRRRRADGVPAPDGEFRYDAIERHLSPHGLELVRAGRLTPRQFLDSSPDPHRVEELWAEPTPRLYEAPTYAICHTPADLAPASAQLPASAEALLSGKQRTIDPNIGWSSEPMGFSFQLDAERELAFPSDCFEVTAAEASTLYQILDANGLFPEPGSWPTPIAGTPPSGWAAGMRAAEVRPGAWYSSPQISSEPIYPHGQPVPWGG